MDSEQLPHNGGAIQIVTDGGYQSGAVINHNAKFSAVITEQDTLAVTQINEWRAGNGLAMEGGEIVTTLSDFDESFMVAGQESADIQETDESADSNVDTDGIYNE